MRSRRLSVLAWCQIAFLPSTRKYGSVSTGPRMRTCGPFAGKLIMEVKGRIPASRLEIVVAIIVLASLQGVGTVSGRQMNSWRVTWRHFPRRCSLATPESISILVSCCQMVEKNCAFLALAGPAPLRLGEGFSASQGAVGELPTIHENDMCTGWRHRCGLSGLRHRPIDIAAIEGNQTIRTAVRLPPPDINIPIVAWDDVLRFRIVCIDGVWNLPWR